MLRSSLKVIIAAVIFIMERDSQWITLRMNYLTRIFCPNFNRSMLIPGFNCFN
jgi:hypothetical protein